MTSTHIRIVLILHAYRQKDVTPWDAGTLQPPLKELIESKRVPLPTTGRALVPGCGKVNSGENAPDTIV